MFQETHDFLVLTDSIIICIYRRATDRHFREQGNVRHPTSKLLKRGLVQTLNTFRNPSLRIFATEKAYLCLAPISLALFCLVRFCTSVLLPCLLTCALTLVRLRR